MHHVWIGLKNQHFHSISKVAKLYHGQLAKGIMIQVPHTLGVRSNRLIELAQECLIKSGWKYYSGHAHKAQGIIMHADDRRKLMSPQARHSVRMMLGNNKVNFHVHLQHIYVMFYLKVSFTSSLVPANSLRLFRDMYCQSMLQKT